MKPINETFENHQLCKAEQKLRRRHILDTFGAWIGEESFDDWHLCLYRFASIRPLHYFDPKTVDMALEFFEQHPQQTLKTLSQQEGPFTHSILSLVRKGSSWENESSFSLKEPKDISSFETVWHPQYQRYCEHVFNHLIQIHLGVLGSIRGKDYQSPALANRVEILKNNNLGLLARGFNATVRNAISHGSASFGLSEIEYSDRNRKEILTPWEFSRLFDELVDTCHAMLIALILFLCNHREEVENTGLEKIPLGLRFLFIDASCSHRGFRVVSMFESQAVGQQKQLNIACSIETLSRFTQLFETFNVAWHSIKFGGQRYNRIGITLDCNKAVSPSLFLNADRLRQAMAANKPIEACVPEILETSLLWYDTSRFRSKIYIWKSLLSLIWQTTKAEILQEWRKRGLKTLRSRYLIRHIENKSTKDIRRIEAHVILRDRGPIDGDLLGDIIRHALKCLKKHRLKKLGFGEEGWFKGRPRYIWIRLYARDKRVRSLSAEWWNDKNLILRAEWFSRWQHYGPIVVKNPHTVFRRIRIEYNPTLLEEDGNK